MRRLAVIVNDACAWDSRSSYSQARGDEQAARLASVGVLFIDCELLRLEVKNQLLGFQCITHPSHHQSTPN